MLQLNAKKIETLLEALTREEGYTLLCTAPPLFNVEIKMEKSVF